MWLEFSFALAYLDNSMGLQGPEHEYLVGCGAVVSIHLLLSHCSKFLSNSKDNNELHNTCTIARD